MFYKTKLGKPDSRGNFKRDLGRDYKGRIPRFYLGTNEDEARIRQDRLQRAWAIVEQSNPDTWSEWSLAIAKAVAKGEPSVTLRYDERLFSGLGTELSRRHGFTNQPQCQIVGCTFRHKDADSGSGVQTKGGSKNITIQRCRFENAGGRAVNIGGSTGLSYFRPKSSGYEAKDITVEDCTFIGSVAPVSFVGVDGAVVRFNTIYRPTRWIIRILQETRGSNFVPCRNGVFSNNIIAFRSDELRTAVNVGGGAAPKTFKFEKNLWYCIDNPGRSDRISLPVKETGGTYGVNPQFKDEQNGDLGLKQTSPVRDAGVRKPD